MKNVHPDSWKSTTKFPSSPLLSSGKIKIRIHWSIKRDQLLKSGSLIASLWATINWRHTVVDGTKFWISYKWPAFLSSFSRWQLIQKAVPSCGVNVKSQSSLNGEPIREQGFEIWFGLIFIGNLPLKIYYSLARKGFSLTDENDRIWPNFTTFGLI